MKKVASLLLIAVLTLTMGVGAFADGTPMMPYASSLSDDERHDDYFVDEFMDFSPRISWTGTENIVTIASGEMFLVQDNRIVAPGGRLRPNAEYIFEIYYNSGPDATHDITTPMASNTYLVPLREEIISGSAPDTTSGRLRLRSGRGGNAISRSEIRTTGSGPARRFRLQLDTRENYNTRMTEVTFSLLTSGNLPSLTIGASTLAQPVTSTVEFEVGWPRMTEDMIDGYAEGDTVTISNEYPVIMRRQIDRLVRNFNYRPIHLAFEDGSWEYTGRMSGMGDTNFFTTHDVIPALMNNLDQDFKFLSMPAGVTFPTNGEMRIDVSDVSSDWSRIYTYLYRNGRLTPINTSYDPLDDMIYFRTNFLGAFVMTDVEITDHFLITQPGHPEIENEPNIPEISDVHNPPTGAAAAGLNHLLMSLGTLSMLGAGATLIRRKK